MKIVLPILALLVIAGVLYGLAFVGVLPVQKWADKSPKLAPVLRALHLAKARRKMAPLTAAAPPDLAQQALAEGAKAAHRRPRPTGKRPGGVRGPEAAGGIGSPSGFLCSRTRHGGQTERHLRHHVGR